MQRYYKDRSLNSFYRPTTKTHPGFKQQDTSINAQKKKTLSVTDELDSTSEVNKENDSQYHN